MSRKIKPFFLIKILYVCFLSNSSGFTTVFLAAASLPFPVVESLPFSQDISGADFLLSSEADSLAVVNEYQQLLDSAARYEQEENYPVAAEYYAKGMDAYQDYYVNKLQKINRKMANTYQVEKKELELEQLNQALLLRKKQTVLLSILIAGLFTAFILFFFLQKYRLRMIRQCRRQKEHEAVRLKLEKEKKEIEAQINTQQAQKAQKRLMMEALLLEYKNNVLEELSLFFANHVALNKNKDDLRKIINADVASELDISAFEHLQQIHPTFCERLQKQGNNKLTTLDLKYCRLIYLKMSSKEMADILKVTPRTIRVNKYRLKQKLGLKKEDNLGDFMVTMG